MSTIEWLSDVCVCRSGSDDRHAVSARSSSALPVNVRTPRHHSHQHRISSGSSSSSKPSRPTTDLIRSVIRSVSIDRFM